MTEYTSPQTAEDVTEEMIQMARNVVDGWYEGRRVDWDDVWSRLDGSSMEDGTQLDLPQDLLSPVFAVLRREAKPSD